MDKTPATIANEYKTLLAWVRQQPESMQYQYGERLRALQIRYRVEVEARQVRIS